MNKIYTKKGDRGDTKTFKGSMSKGDQLAIALGTVDELNSWIGACRKECSVFGVQYPVISNELKRIQNNLLIIGSGLAGSSKKLGATETRRLEKVIDKMTAELPVLSNFIFPTGLGGAAYLQVARTVTRRAEREMVLFIKSNNENLESKRVLKYLNRLSDGLFTMARWVNMKLGGVDEVWK